MSSIHQIVIQFLAVLALVIYSRWDARRDCKQEIQQEIDQVTNLFINPMVQEIPERELGYLDGLKSALKRLER